MTGIIICSAATTVIVALIVGYASYHCGIDYATKVAARTTVEIITKSLMKHGCDPETIAKLYEIIRNGID